MGVEEAHEALDAEVSIISLAVGVPRRLDHALSCIDLVSSVALSAFSPQVMILAEGVYWHALPVAVDIVLGGTSHTEVAIESQTVGVYRLFRICPCLLVVVVLVGVQKLVIIYWLRVCRGAARCRISSRRASGSVGRAWAEWSRLLLD